MTIELNDQKPEIILTFKGDKVIKETVGFQGKSCVEASKFVEELLKPKEQKITLKADYLDDPVNPERELLA